MYVYVFEGNSVEDKVQFHITFPSGGHEWKVNNNDVVFEEKLQKKWNWKQETAFAIVAVQSYKDNKKKVKKSKEKKRQFIENDSLDQCN